MDKMFGVYDFFGSVGTSVNSIVLILPVLVVIVGVVVVFLFGSNNNEKPKGNKISEQSNNNKRQKRSSPDVTSAQLPASKPTAVLQKPVKKEDAKLSTTVKSNNIGTNVASTTKPVTKTNKKVVAPAPVKKSGSVKEKKAAKTAEKPLDNSANDGGEWQTVITKKQKKSITDFIVQPVPEIDVSVRAKTTPKKNIIKNSNDNKQAKEQANKTKKATIEQQKQQETENKEPEVIPVDNKVFVEQIEAAVPTPFVAFETAATRLQTAAISSLSMPTVKAVEPVEVIAVPAASVTNVAFDELGDAAWTEAKIPKKSKKRALRE